MSTCTKHYKTMQIKLQTPFPVMMFDYIKKVIEKECSKEHSVYELVSISSITTEENNVVFTFELVTPAPQKDNQ